MKINIATFNTDQVNKYGYRFTIEALESALLQGWKGTPMCISHDYHRPIGISRVLGLHLHSSQALLKGAAIFSETEDELEKMQRMAQQYFAQKLSEINEMDLEQLRSAFSDHLSNSAIFLARECTCVIDVGVAKRAFPTLFIGDETDKRSLYPIKELEQIGPGVFKIDKYAVFAHRYFRRSLSQINNLNSIFLEKLYELRNESELNLKIALDPNSIGLADTYRAPIELEYWRGPKFNDDLKSIDVGVACHKASEKERFFHGIGSTEFWWHKQNGKHSLECEEILDIPTLGIDENTYGCRYVHSIVDETTELPDHLDGAIREYSADSFLQRIEVDISKAGKNTRYVKLWRIDGALQLSRWKELICDFFMGNPLPGEYLHGSCNQKQVEENFRPLKDKHDLKKVILEPLSVSEKDSVHIAVSYHSLNDFSLAQNRSIVCFDSLITSARKRRIIELSAIDLIKSVNRNMPVKLEYPNDALFVAYDDLDINFPLFLFQGNESLEDAKKWLQCLIELLQKFIDSGESRFITASVGLRYGDIVVVFSFAGFAYSFVEAFNKGIKEFPTAFDNIGKWCSDTQKILSTAFKASQLTEAMQKMFHLTGCFSFPRSYSISEYISIDDKGKIIARIPSSEKAVAQAIHENRLKVTQANLVKKCSCLACGNNYLDCACSVFLDMECRVRIDELELLGFFLTERA